MFTNYFKNTKYLNTIDLENQSGIKIYYDKTSIVISLVIYSSFFIITSIFFLQLLRDKPYGFIALLVIFLYLDKILKLLEKLYIKNPIFILSEEKLYYLFSNTWYSIADHTFVDRMTTKYDIFETFCVLDKKEYTIIRERNWYFKKIDQMKARIKYIKIMNARK